MYSRSSSCIFILYLVLICKKNYKNQGINILESFSKIHCGAVIWIFFLLKLLFSLPFQSSKSAPTDISSFKEFLFNPAEVFVPA